MKIADERVAVLDTVSACEGGRQVMCGSWISSFCLLFNTQYTMVSTSDLLNGSIFRNFLGMYTLNTLSWTLKIKNH